MSRSAGLLSIGLAALLLGASLGSGGQGLLQAPHDLPLDADALATARILLQDRTALVGGMDDPAAFRAQVQAQLRDVADAQRMVEAFQGAPADPVERAVTMATLGPILRAGLEPDALHPDMAPPLSLGKATETLAERHSVPLGAAVLGDLGDVERAPAVSGALRNLVGAFAAMDAAASAGSPNAPAVAQLLVARQSFLQALAPLRDAVAESRVARLPPLIDRIDVPNLFVIDFAGTSDTYTADYRLIVDFGGDDTYLNNAGGGCGAGVVAAVVDFAGADSYTSGRSCGVNGGACCGGAGLLVDAGGDDTYAAGSEGTNGGSYGAFPAMLLDAAGNDTYSAGWQGANGGAYRGLPGGGWGALLDMSGADTYSAGSHGSNGGAGGGLGGPQVAGLLFDGGGSDRYHASGWMGSNGGGGAYGATGFLLDAGGDDAYEAEPGLILTSTNGGGWYLGRGFLYDLGGDDKYLAPEASSGNGGGSQGGSGALVDAAGDDLYVGKVRGVNGGAHGGFVAGVGPSAGLLVDGGGDDTYRAIGPSVNGGAYLAVGLLFDGAGSDIYDDQDGGAGTDRTVVPKGILGAQIDAPG